MRVASLTSLILLATVSAPLAAPYRIDSRHHQEGRPDAATLVPPDWRLQRDEQRYVSPDGSSWFAPHASPVGSEPIARHMDRIARNRRARPSLIVDASLIGSPSPASRPAGYSTGRLCSHAAARYGTTLSLNTPQRSSDAWIRLLIAPHTASITRKP